MRCILPAGGLVILALVLCGCIQSPAASPPVVNVLPEPVTATVPVTTATPHPAMEVNVTAEKAPDSVLIRVDGGKDAGSLTALSVRIRNYDGTSVQRTLPFPETGKEYSIQYYRGVNAASVNIVGTFSDGYQQTLLMSSL